MLEIGLFERLAARVEEVLAENLFSGLYSEQVIQDDGSVRKIHHLGNREVRIHRSPTGRLLERQVIRQVQTGHEDKEPLPTILPKNPFSPFD